MIIGITLSNIFFIAFISFGIGVFIGLVGAVGLVTTEKKEEQE